MGIIPRRSAASSRYQSATRVWIWVRRRLMWWRDNKWRGGGERERRRLPVQGRRSFFPRVIAQSNWRLAKLIIQWALHYSGYQLTGGNTHSSVSLVWSRGGLGSVRSIGHDISRVALNAFRSGRVWACEFIYQEVIGDNLPAVTGRMDKTPCFCSLDTFSVVIIVSICCLIH